jgi:NADPH:quinone reductase-like Zn-dependent oxidoreductase
VHIVESGTREAEMSKAVRFDRYGDVEVLHVDEVAPPVPGPGEVLVRVRAAGINPGEAAVREGLFARRWPARFPSGQGSDLAGLVVALGPGVERFALGDAVLGFTERRASQAELVAVPAENLVSKPPSISWEVAGSLFVVGTTAFAAVRAVAPRPGETVAVSGAAGGVGSLAVQLCRRAGARVIGLASPRHHPWLQRHDVIPVTYGEGVADRVRAAAQGHLDAFIDTHGGGYVDLALELGVAPQRIDTLIDFDAAAKHNVQTAGNADAADAATLQALVTRVAEGELEVPIARTFPLEEVQAAYRELSARHTLGKIVLVP